LAAVAAMGGGSKEYESTSRIKKAAAAAAAARTAFDLGPAQALLAAAAQAGGNMSGRCSRCQRQPGSVAP
jgi:hypothetical protein